MIRDIDRVFAMLDGKAELEVSLESVLDRNLQELKREARLSGSYFDVRHLPRGRHDSFLSQQGKESRRPTESTGRETSPMDSEAR